MRFFIGTVLSLVGVSCAVAQIDATALHLKYGAPLQRETFMVRPGIEMIVDYGPTKQVCRIQLPSGEQIVGKVFPETITKTQIAEILDELVPPLIRGKTIYTDLIAMVNTISFTSSEYEHVTIVEAKVKDIGKGITVTFKDPACREKLEQ